MDRKVAGFSILELLIIIAILSILMTVGVREYIRYKEDRELMRQANMLADELSWIRSQSIAKEPHGIVVNLSNYTIFKDLDRNCQFSSGDSIVSSKDFISGVTATTSVSGVFDRRGYVLSSENCGLGMSSMTLTNRNNNKKIIAISKYGKIQIK